MLVQEATVVATVVAVILALSPTCGAMATYLSSSSRGRRLRSRFTAVAASDNQSVQPEHFERVVKGESRWLSAASATCCTVERQTQLTRISSYLTSKALVRCDCSQLCSSRLSALARAGRWPHESAPRQGAALCTPLLHYWDCRRLNVVAPRAAAATQVPNPSPRQCSTTRPLIPSSGPIQPDNMGDAAVTSGVVPAGGAVAEPAGGDGGAAPKVTIAAVEELLVKEFPPPAKMVR